MPTSLHSYRQAVLESALALLWRQWVLLGIPGHARASGNQPEIIDPEALLLVTSELGRFDARLFEEVLRWLENFGKLINIQRLRSLHLAHALGDPRVLATVASTLLKKNRRLAKWNAIASLAPVAPGREPLFLNPDGTGTPIFGEPDPVFEQYGFFRTASVAASSKRAAADSLARNIAHHPELLLMKLRALFGVNARAEIIAALLAQSSSHPAVLARRIGYLPRSVQDTLNEMALSGLLASNRAPGSREKYFTLRSADWTFLLPSSETSAFPTWITWPALFALLQDTIVALYSPKLGGASELMLALRLREIFDRHYPTLSEAGLAGRFMKSSQASGRHFIDILLEELAALT